MNRWNQGWIVAAGFSLLLLAPPALADEKDTDAQKIGEGVRDEVYILKQTEPKDRAGVATQIHKGVLDKAEGLASPKAEPGFNAVRQKSYDSLDTRTDKRPPSRSAPVRGSFGSRGLGR